MFFLNATKIALEQNNKRKLGRKDCIVGRIYHKKSKRYASAPVYLCLQFTVHE